MRSLLWKIVTLAAGAGICAATPALAQNLVVNGGFETGDFTGWTQSGNTGFTGVDTGSANTGTFGAYFGPVGSLGSIDQTIHLDRPGNWKLTYFLSNDGGTPSEFQATVAGQTAEHLVNPPGFGYRESTFVFSSGVGDVGLTFAFQQDPAYFHLDDVMLFFLGREYASLGLPLTQNQSHVAGAVGVLQSLGSFDIPAYLDSFLDADLPAALDSLSGEGTVGTQFGAFGLQSLFQSSLLHRITGLGMPSASGKWTSWVSALGGTSSFAGEPTYIGSSDLTDPSAGLAFGAQKWFRPNLLIGAAAAIGFSSFNDADRATSGSSDGSILSLYGNTFFGTPAGQGYFAGTLTFGRYSNETHRDIASAGVSETGSFDSNEVGGSWEVGVHHHLHDLVVTPFAWAEFLALYQPGYTETQTALGAPVLTNFALDYASHRAISLPVALGVQFDRSVTLPRKGIVDSFFRAAWVHEFFPDRFIEASFDGFPASIFRVNGPPVPANLLRLSTGATLNFSQAISFTGALQGDIWQNGFNWDASGRFDFRF